MIEAPGQHDALPQLPRSRHVALAALTVPGAVGGWIKADEGAKSLGGRLPLDMLLSTNPIAVAIPAGREPQVVLDMATTVAAYGSSHSCIIADPPGVC